MSLCHVMHHVTVVTGLFIIQEKQKKRNIKLRKIVKKKKNVCQVQMYHNILNI